MAQIIGYIGTSHIPAIGGAIARNLQQDNYWKPFFDGFPAAREWLAANKPDVAVMFYNDHGLNFFLDKMPTFAVGAASEYTNADEGWGLPNYGSYRGYPELSWHIIEQLLADEFDPMTCQEMQVDHAFSIPMKLLWPEGNPTIRTVPIAINTVQHPLPSLKRCLNLGRAVGRAIKSYPGDLRVMIVGTGGLSHQLDGERAGFINTAFDREFMASLTRDPTWVTKFSAVELVEQAGTQGVELLMWLTARATLTSVREIAVGYHVPISNTAAGMMLLEPAA